MYLVSDLIGFKICECQVSGTVAIEPYMGCKIVR